MSFLVMEGLIIPSEWDSNGKILGISLSTFDEDVFPIMQNAVGKELLNHIREEVEVMGALKKIDDEQIIEVKEYSTRKRRKSCSTKNNSREHV